MLNPTQSFHALGVFCTWASLTINSGAEWPVSSLQSSTQSRVHLTKLPIESCSKAEAEIHGHPGGRPVPLPVTADQCFLVELSRIVPESGEHFGVAEVTHRAYIYLFNF